MPSYKLTYFNARGRAELTRLIFAAAGVEFTDVRVSDWPATKGDAPLGQLPYLEVDGVKLPQSVSIARFVAREFNLAGKTNLEMAQADAIVDTIVEVVNQFYAKVFSVQDPAQKEEAMQAFLLDQGAKGAQSIEKLIGLYGKNGHSVGDDLTWADILIYEITMALFTKVSSYADKFPKIAEVYKHVAENEKITNYIKNRPETQF